MSKPRTRPGSGYGRPLRSSVSDLEHGMDRCRGDSARQSGCSRQLSRARMCLRSSRRVRTRRIPSAIPAAPPRRGTRRSSSVGEGRRSCAQNIACAGPTVACPRKMLHGYAQSAEQPWPRRTGSPPTARSTNPDKLAAYAQLAGPAITAGGGKFLVRGTPAKTYEAGLNQRTVVVAIRKPGAGHRRPRQSCVPSCPRRARRWRRTRHQAGRGRLISLRHTRI